MPSLHVERLVPAPGAFTLTVAEIDALLETVYLAMAADRKLTDDEIGVFAKIVSRVRALETPETSVYRRPGLEKPPALTMKELNALLDDLVVRLDHASIADRLKVVTKALPSREGRLLAYRLASAMGIVDLDATKSERDFCDDLGEAFGISEEEADELEQAALSDSDPTLDHA